MSAPDTRRQRFRRFLTPFATVLTAALLLVAGGTAAAQAAPPYTTNGTVSNLQFENAEITGGSTQKMTAEWSFPDRPATPAGFTIDFPSTMEGRGDTFSLTAQDTGATIGTCVATKTQLQCDLDPAYVAANPVGLKGDVNFWVTVRDSVEESQEKTYDFGGHSVTVTVVPNPVCTENCDFEWQYRKDGIIDYANDTISWYVHIESERGGMLGGEEVVVEDLPDANQTLILDLGTPSLQRTNQIGVDGDGIERPQNFQTVPQDQITVDPDGKLRFTADAGYVYQAVYKTKIAPGAKLEYYTNHVNVTIDGVLDGNFDGSTRYAGGGGSGIGSDVGVFTVTKALTGSAANLPADQEFTGTYVVTTPGGETKNGTWTVKAGETWRSDEFPRDSTVKLAEDAPTQPGNVTWASPSFSTNDFTLPGGTLTPVTVTNQADVKTGGFDAAKQVTGSEGALALVPADATFQLDYTYPAGTGFEAGSGSLTLDRDGTVVQSPAIPVGAEVTVTEAAPAAVDGIAWGDAVITPSTFTVGETERVTVAVENPVTETLGNFTLQKTVTGPAGALALVPADGEYVFDYSYPAGDGFEAGSGSITVKGDGTPVTSGNLPVGAVVTLVERAPADVEGLGWGTPVITPQTFTIEAGTPVAVTAENPVFETLGGFSLTKSVSGDASGLVPEGTVFTVGYEWTAADGTTGSGSVDVTAGAAPATVEGIPGGSVVTLTEQSPGPVDGVEWLDPQFSENGFEIIAGQTIAIDLDNPTELVTGTFGVQKVVDGSGASLVPADAVFAVNYTYPAGNGFEAGAGQLLVRADGAVVESGPIPYGAVVTLTEGTPDAVEGATWTGASFDVSEVTAGSGTIAQVTLTNTIESNPVPPTTAPPTEPGTTEPGTTPGPTTPGDDLAQTGGEWNVGLTLAIVAALVAAGGVLLVRARRSARD